MANTTHKDGFLLARTTREVERQVFSIPSSNSSAMAVGDAVTKANNSITRAAGGTTTVDGVIESFVPKAKSGQGPESLDYLPVSTAAEAIVITDRNAIFEVEIATVADSDFDADAKVDIDDTAPDATLRKSNQGVTLSSGSQMLLVGMSDRLGNVTGAYARVYVKLLPET